MPGCGTSMPGCWRPVLGCGMSVAGCRRPVLGCGMSVAGCRRPVLGCGAQSCNHGGRSPRVGAAAVLVTRVVGHGTYGAAFATPPVTATPVPTVTRTPKVTAAGFARIVVFLTLFRPAGVRTRRHPL